MANRIVKIGVAGYKSAMSPIAVNLRDITVLAGPNSAGKSTVIQPLLMIKQTLEKPFDPGGLAIDGPLVRFTSTEQFLSARQRRDAKGELIISIETTDNFYSIIYHKLPDGPLAPTRMQFRRDDGEFFWNFDQNVPLSDPSVDSENTKRLGRLFSGRNFRIIRTGCWLSAAVEIPSVGQKVPPEFFPVRSPIAGVMQEVRSIIHLPGLRGNPERHYIRVGVNKEYSGEFTNYVASIIHFWERQGDDRLRRLGNDLRKLGLTWKVQTRPLDETRVEIRVGRLPAPAQGGARDLVSIADVGFGVSQALPVAVALLVAREDQLVYVEQPEIHLHPRAQVAMADLLLEAADRGVRVIVETHSSLLLLALQTLVAEKRLAPERLSLNWFSRDARGQTHVAEAQLHADGSYGDWPEDFGDVEMRLQRQFLDGAGMQHDAAAE